jgi:X-Pro dipeptidyl-peptidase
MKAALLMSHGFNDWNVMPEHSYRIYAAAKAKGLPVQLYYHQDGHGGPPPMKMMNRWFTRYLHGVENGVENDPRAWIVRENETHENPTPYEDYPNPNASPVKFFLESGAPGQGSLSTEKAKIQGTEKLIDNYNFSGTSLAKAEVSDHRLIYVTPVLSDNLHLSGVPKITIKLSSSKPAANLSVWLVSIPSSEKSLTDDSFNVITRGWADPQNHSSITKGEPLIPGKFYELTFDLMPDDQIIPEGQKIGLMIFSSDKEFTLWPEPGTELTLDLDKTNLELPIVGGVKSYNNAVLEK